MKRTALLTLAFACLPIFAQANIISLEYTGHVTTILGGGYGNAIGDTVSGKMNIDLSKATTKTLDTPTAVNYFSPSPDGLITNDASFDDWGGVDFLDIYNGSHINWMGESEDFFQIIDSITANPVFSDYVQISVTLNNIDWLTDLSLNGTNINTNDSSILGWSFGSISRTEGTLESDGSYSWAVKTDIFSLDSLKLASAEVPEPGSLVLLLIGGLALVLRRRRS